METYAEAREKERSNAEIMGQKRQDKALREFKQVLEDLVFLLRSASGMETVYMYWINRSREQFVLETKSTSLPNVMFEDRVALDSHFLHRYRDITEPVTIEVGQQVEPEALGHYYEEVPVSYLTILPFTNNEETVALTVLESKKELFTDQQSEVIYSYIQALRNMLNTYLEISDLYQKQEEWIDYEDSLAVLDTRAHRTQIIDNMINAMQQMLGEGGVSFLAQAGGVWSNVLNARDARHAPPIGMPVEKRTLAFDALEKGHPEFSIHFNDNPKRISPRELHTEGATLAIPMLMKERRQGLVLVYDQNPLLFKESTKHKLVNFVRVAGLQIMANNGSLDLETGIFTNSMGALLPDLWEKSVDTELYRKKNELTRHYTWLGLITLSELPSIRTKLRLEELQRMQNDMVEAFNPGRFGISGSIGFHSDYVYSFIIQSRDRKAVEKWSKSLKKEFREPFQLSNGKEISSGIKVGFTLLGDDLADSYEAISNAKAALSQAMKSRQEQGQ